MLRALVALALLMPLAAAEPAANIRSCSSNHCVILRDADGDGAYDWANAAVVVGEQLYANGNANGTTFAFAGGATSEELLEEAPFVGLDWGGWMDATQGAREARLTVEAYRGDEERGATRVASIVARVGPESGERLSASPHPRLSA